MDTLVSTKLVLTVTLLLICPVAYGCDSPTDSGDRAELRVEALLGTWDYSYFSYSTRCRPDCPTDTAQIVRRSGMFELLGPIDTMLITAGELQATLPVHLNIRGANWSYFAPHSLHGDSVNALYTLPNAVANVHSLRGAPRPSNIVIVGQAARVFATYEDTVRFAFGWEFSDFRPTVLLDSTHYVQSRATKR